MEHVETDSVWRVIYIYVWRVIYISIVVRQTMVCWRPHFPLLCVKQWHADVSTFHCCGQTMVCGCQHFPLCVSPWKLCFGSGIRIRYPDRHQNLMEWSLGSWLPSRNILFKSVHNFLSNPANRQTDRQTDKQTNRGEYITFAQLRWRM